MKKFLASLLNEPWLIDESWLATLVQSFLGAGAPTDPKMLEVFKSERVMGTRSAKIRGSKAVVPIHGPIFSRPNILTEWFGIGMVLGSLTSDIQKLLENPNVETILLDIDSPGGTVTGINEAVNFIKSASAEKPITAYVGGVGASAAYWLASAADEIVLDATSRVGSIGVVAAYPTKSGDADYIEIVNTASPNKRPDVSTKEGKKVITDELDDIADVFISTIAENRGVSEKTVKSDFGKGGVLVGQKAIAAGMADRLGSFEELMVENNDIIEGDSSMKLTIATLKADHKDVYDEVVASVKTSDTGDKDASLEASQKALTSAEAEVEDLKSKLADSKTKENDFSARVVALEKQDILRAEEATKNQAGAIMSGALTASSLPERLRSKVTPVDYNQHMTDGKLDVAAYTTAVNAEVKDWEDTIAATNPIQSTTTAPKAATSDDADDEVVNRMLGHVQPIKKEA